MHIKQVIIEGFKSYKDQTRTEPFSSRINTIVGANGSGKSNFFQAIRFVLDADTSSLRQEDRQKLLHEGAGHAVLSAYVEIVLDNSDGRIQVEKDEIRLRRTVGLKKDEYHLNKKKITKTEVSDTLESAGFSKANPYYVVQQGKIMALSTMKDEERLDLLKEIGGSKVYEDRRKESLKTIQEAEGRKRQIDELVTEMEGKLEQLDAEKEELAKYQTIDKERRSLEYAIYSNEVSDTRTKLEKVEEERQEETKRASQALDEQKENQATLKRVKKELKVLEAQHSSAQELLAESTSGRQEAVKKLAKLELDIKDIEERQEQDQEQQAQCQEELKALSKEISKLEKLWNKAEKDLSGKKAVAETARLEFDVVNQRLKALDAKQGEGHNFATPAERDQWIQKCIKTWGKEKTQYEQQIQDLQRDADALQDSRAGVSERIADLQQQQAEVERKLQSLDQQATATRKKRSDALEEVKDANRSIDELQPRSRQLSEETKKLEEKAGPGGVDHRDALMRAREICKQHNIPMHGTVLDNIKVIPQLFVAVEVVAEGALFNLIVDTDAQAQQVLDELRKSATGGRVTCLPLNKLRPVTIKYPENFGTDASPLSKYLKCHEHIKPALDHVFAKWMICKDSDVASKVIASTTAVNCVTIEGDKHEKKGKICGGHRDTRRFRLEFQQQLVKARSELTKIQQTIASLKVQADEKQQVSDSYQSEEETLKLTRKNAEMEMRRLQRDIAIDREQLKDLDSDLLGKRESIKTCQASITRLEAHIAEHQKTLGSKELGKLSPGEQKEKRELQPQLSRLESRKTETSVAATHAEDEFARLDAQLSNNLRRQEADLKQKMAAADLSVDRQDLQSKQEELAEAKAAGLKMEAGEQEAQQKVEALTQQIQDLNSQAERCRDAQNATNLGAEEEASRMNQLISKRAALLQKKSDLEKKIRDLGSLPAEAFEKFQHHSLTELRKSLTKAQNALKKYGHVNKKALDQYVNFTEQRDELVRRQEEAIRSKQKIQQLIQTLDLRKDEAIERTFKGVARNFKEIFAELAPGGKGELVMQKSANHGKEAQETGSDEASPVLERYCGVRVRVSFGAGDTMSLKQLSGGQKTLVALALIFSIQRLDPAPFYLFDEIDAALDPAYRTTVARMLAKQANDPHNPSQFIVTTFHPQIVHETDQVYGVSHSARISTVDAISKEDALDFVNAEERRNAQKGNDSE